MSEKTKKAIAVIGDLIDSKKIKNRFEFQKRFAKNLEEMDQLRIESPYTLTLGDEFQALYTDGRGLASLWERAALAATFIVAVKGLARFKKMEEHQTFAEYVIIGTFLSVLLTLLIYKVTRWMY